MTSTRPRVSVCMATYNGTRFLEEQVRSILEQLGPDDELVAVDDRSTDGTVAMLRAFGDPRIQVHENERNRRAPATFARAISLARGEIILLADQDDAWLPGRVDALVAALAAPGVAVVASNSEYVDAEGRPVAFPMPPLDARDSRRRLVNVGRIYTGRAAYYGCAMAFRASFRRVLLPLPRYVEAHDLWTAMAGNLAGAIVHLDRATLRRRIHGNNASVIVRPLYRKLWARVKFTAGLAQLSMRLVLDPNRKEWQA